MAQSTRSSSERDFGRAQYLQGSPSVSSVASCEPGQNLSDPAELPNTSPGHGHTTVSAHTPCKHSAAMLGNSDVNCSWDQANGNTVLEGSTPATEPFGGEREMWNPFWYRKQTLILYASLFLLLAVTILILRFVSVRNNGLASQSQTSETIFFWKYLPTAGA